MTRGLIGLLIVTWLHHVAVAGPAPTPPDETKPPDQNAAVTASPPVTASPWLDQAPALALTKQEPPDNSRSKWISGATLAGLYAGFWGWAYIAWYRDHPEDVHHVGGDGWFGKTTYAGGSDKLGHAWATMVLARGGNALLSSGGWGRTESALISAAMSELLFFGVEMKDYLYYEFSPGDMTFNTLGALAAIAFDLSPRLDELFDYRVEWWPSKQYRYNLTSANSPCEARTTGSCSRWNVAEDYSGETFLLALHLGAIHPLRDMKYGTWSRFVDVAVGFEGRNYKPEPTLLMETETTVLRHQTLFLGVTLNVQGVFDYLLPTQSKTRKVTHGVFEVLTPPWTTFVPARLETTRTSNRAVSGGA